LIISIPDLSTQERTPTTSELFETETEIIPSTTRVTGNNKRV
jgi:hypothetical protein